MLYSSYQCWTYKAKYIFISKIFIFLFFILLILAAIFETRWQESVQRISRGFRMSTAHPQSRTNCIINTSAVVWQTPDCFNISATHKIPPAVYKPFFWNKYKWNMLRILKFYNHLLIDEWRSKIHIYNKFISLLLKKVLILFSNYCLQIKLSKMLQKIINYVFMNKS